MTVVWVNACLAAIFLSIVAMAEQETPTSFQRIPAELSSPWTTPARPWLLWGTAMTLSFLAAQDSGDSIQRELGEEKPLGKFSIVGDYAGQLVPNALYLAGMYTTYWLSKNPKYRQRGLIMLKATAYSGGASTFLKVVIKEKRPNKENDWTSFPSGHATTAFAFASVVTAQHGFWPYGFLAISLATLTGVSRMNDNMHYGHDVVAGATLGTVFGLGVSYVNSALDRKEVPVVVAPAVDSGLVGIHVLLPFD